MELEEYVAARGAALVRLGFLLTGDAHTAQDLAQAALVKCLGRWSRISRLEHPDAYVRRTLVTTYLSDRRRRWIGEVTVAEWPETAGSHDADRAVDDRDDLRRVLARLTRRERTVLVLRHHLDLDDESIASLLGVSRSTVRATASRGTAHAREVWDEVVGTPVPGPAEQERTP